MSSANPITKEQTRKEKVWEVLRQTGQDIGKDDVSNWAAAVAYYAVLSAVPLMLAAVAISGFFVEPQWAVQRIMGFVGEFLPQGQQQLRETIQEMIEGRETASILSILAFLWAGTRVFEILTRALNIVYDVEERYSFFKRLLIELVMLLTLGGLFLSAIASSWVLGMLWEGAAAIGWLVSAALLILAFYLLYRYVPRGNQEWKSSLSGAVVATTLFLLVRLLFGIYIERFANYNVIYGSLAIAVILLVWAWVMSFIILAGGELASKIQKIMVEGKTTEEVNRISDEVSRRQVRIGFAPK